MSVIDSLLETVREAVTAPRGTPTGPTGERQTT
jgi:hypothetical protein